MRPNYRKITNLFINWKKFILVLFFQFFFISFLSYAKIRLNISIIHKRGIDKGLILTSELHSVEDVEFNKKVVLEMKSGLRVEMRPKFATDPVITGPSDLLQITGEIYQGDGQLIKSFVDGPIFAKLGKKKVVVYRKDTIGQLIEISIHPEIR